MSYTREQRSRRKNRIITGWSEHIVVDSPTVIYEDPQNLADFEA